MNVKLYLHDGTKYEENVEGFNLIEFIAKINKDSHEMIQFGGLGITKNAIKMVDTNPTEAATE